MRSKIGKSVLKPPKSRKTPGIVSALAPERTVYRTIQGGVKDANELISLVEKALKKAEVGSVKEITVNILPDRTTLRRRVDTTEKEG